MPIFDILISVVIMASGVLIGQFYEGCAFSTLCYIIAGSPIGYMAHYLCLKSERY